MWTTLGDSYFLGLIAFKNRLAFVGQPQSPHESSEDSTAFVTEDETPQSPRNEELPTQESIVKATEQITKKIQELLLAAQGSRHSRYVFLQSTVFFINSFASFYYGKGRYISLKTLSASFLVYNQLAALLNTAIAISNYMAKVDV